MSLSVVLEASSIVQTHIAFALPGVVLGSFVLFGTRRGSRWHKWLGYLWVVSMAGLALSGLLIPSEFALIGRFGPLHLLSCFTLWSLWRGISCARAGNIGGHRAYFEGLWLGGIGITGLLSLLPGRTMSHALFGEQIWLGWWVIGGGALLLALIWMKRNRSVLRQA